MTTSIIAAGYSHANAQDSTQQSSPGDLVNAMHSAFGDNHSRAVHAKGIILEGTFVPNKDAAEITKASFLQSQASKVLLRFSDFTGIPTIPDNNPAANPRGLGIKFVMPDNTTADIICHSFNGFHTATSDEFRELLLAIGASVPDAKKPTALDNFLASHPIAKTFLQHNTLLPALQPSIIMASILLSSRIKKECLILSVTSLLLKPVKNILLPKSQQKKVPIIFLQKLKKELHKVRSNLTCMHRLWKMAIK